VAELAARASGEAPPVYAWVQDSSTWPVPEKTGATLLTWVEVVAVSSAPKTLVVEISPKIPATRASTKNDEKIFLFIVYFIKK
jgi:hypothetical protein